MRKAGLYIRVSTLEQAQEGYSIGAQKERLIAFCKAHDWTITDIYVDGGYTGANIDRPGLQKMIAEIGKLDIVLVYKLDRLSRSQKDTLYLIEEVFLPNNVDFVSLNESFDTSTPFGRAMIGILSVFAQLEREQIKERTQMGRIARAKQGLYNGGRPPIGYSYDPEAGKLVVNEYEAIQIKKIFEWYVNGMSSNKILDRLLSEGYTNKYKCWSNGSNATINKILCNDVYLGITHFGDIITENTHEPIITKEQFEKAREIKKKRQEIYGDTAFVSTHLLTGMIFCARCGARYFAKKCYKKYRYYICYSRAKSSKNMIRADNCDNKIWHLDELEAAVEEQISKLLFNKKYYKRLVDEHNKDKAKTSGKTDETNIIKAKISECDKQIDKLMDLYQSDSIPADVLSQRIDKVYREKLQYEEQLERIEPQAPKKDFDAQSVEDMLSDLASIWKIADKPEKRMVLETLVNRIMIDGENIKIEWSFLDNN